MTVEQPPKRRYIGILKWGVLETAVEIDGPRSTYDAIISSKARMVISEMSNRVDVRQPTCIAKYWRLRFFRETEWEHLENGVFRARFELESILYV